jgi:hypothetical protein
VNSGAPEGLAGPAPGRVSLVTNPVISHKFSQNHDNRNTWSGLLSVKHMFPTIMSLAGYMILIMNCLAGYTCTQCSS